MGSDPSRPRACKRWLVPVIVLAVLAGAAVVTGLRSYPQWQQQRWIARAREAFTAKDPQAATHAAQRALAFNDRNIDAVRLLAEISDAAGSPDCLVWRRRLVDLQPELLENHFQLVASALAMGKPALAQEYLQATPVARSIPRYYALAGQVGLGLGARAEAEAAFLEAATLDPANREYPLQLAALRLASPVAEVHQDARKVAEELREDPLFFRRATRLLIEDARRQPDPARALALGEALRQDPQTPFADRLLYLGLLRQFDRPKFLPYLKELQAAAAAEKGQLHALLCWLNGHESASLALEWTKRLPAAALAEMPIPIPVAQACVLVGDWPGLRSVVADRPKEDPLLAGPAAGAAPLAGLDINAPVPPRWEEYEYLRLALLARSFREAHQIQRAAVRWSEALQAASGRPDALQVLARTALDWKWDREATGVLWLVAGGVDGALWALDHLARQYRTIGSARSLLRVATRTLELDPTNAGARHQSAALSFLLGTNMAPALKLASDLYAEDPTDPSAATTYAFGLHLYGRTDEGLAILRTLGDAQLREPHRAAYYGILLAAVRAPEAGEYLEIAKGGRLLMEETKLVEDARTWLRPAASIPTVPRPQEPALTR